MKYLIEFRNGTFFRALSDTNGSPKDKAKQFNSYSEAQKFMRKHTWILVNGGMVIKS